MNKKDLVIKIESSDLDQEIKDTILQRINQTEGEEVDEELRFWVKSQIQLSIDKMFDKADIKLDEDDPEYQAQFKKMTDSIDSAEAEFKNGMEELEKEAKDLQNNAMKQIDDAQIQMIQNKISQE